MFERLSDWVDLVTASPRAFGLALLVVIVWALTGPLVGYSDAWQLTINTGTTIVTFLMVFLLQHSQQKSAARDRALMGALLGRIASLVEQEEREIESLEAALAK